MQELFLSWTTSVGWGVNFRAVLPKTAGSAQTQKSMSFIWIVWSTLYVYLWFLCEKKSSTSIREKPKAAAAAYWPRAPASDLQVKWLSICIASGNYQKYSDYFETWRQVRQHRYWCDLNPILTGQGRNQPLYERHVTKSGRNRGKENKPETSWCLNRKYLKICFVKEKCKRKPTF